MTWLGEMEKKKKIMRPCNKQRKAFPQHFPPRKVHCIRVNRVFLVSWALALCFPSKSHLPPRYARHESFSPIKFSSSRLRLLIFQTKKMKKKKKRSLHHKFSFSGIFSHFYFLTSASVKMRFAATPKDNFTPRLCWYLCCFRQWQKPLKVAFYCLGL